MVSFVLFAWREAPRPSGVMSEESRSGQPSPGVAHAKGTKKVRHQSDGSDCSTDQTTARDMRSHPQAPVRVESLP